jgi:hypothetical protein
MNPHNDPAWIGGIREVRVLTPPPVAAGTRVARVAKFLGRSFEYVLEVADFQPGALLGMRSVSGPFPMRVTYRFDDAAEGTRVQIRVQGDAGKHYWFAAPLMTFMVKRNVARDLRTLRSKLENAGSGS